MTLPSVVPTRYAGTSIDFTRAKQLLNGCMQVEQGAVTVPASTASGTIIGLVPFRRGFSMTVDASRIYTADLDSSTAVTLSVGYVYDDNANNTNAQTAFANAITTAQTGGNLTLSPIAGLTWTATADGWIVVTTGGGSTTTAGDITFQIAGTYGP